MTSWYKEVVSKAMSFRMYDTKVYQKLVKNQKDNLSYKSKRTPIITGTFVKMGFKSILIRESRSKLWIFAAVQLPFCPSI